MVLFAGRLVDEASDCGVLDVRLVDDGKAGFDAARKAGDAGGVGRGELHRNIAHVERFLRQHQRDESGSRKGLRQGRIHLAHIRFVHQRALQTAVQTIAADFDGRARIQVLPKASAMNSEGLRRFVHEVTAIAPGAGGSAVTVIASATTIIDAFREAAVLALVAIAAMLLIFLRKPRDVLLILAPRKPERFAEAETLERKVGPDVAVQHEKRIVAEQRQRVDDAAAGFESSTFAAVCDPDAERGAVMANEKVTLYGIPLVAGRTITYGRIDPELSRDLFIQHALVEG